MNKTKHYPIKHPTIIRDNFHDVHNYCGLIKCWVLCYLFTLKVYCISPYESNVFLMIAVEVIKALEKGYTILEVKEVWHFEETTDPLFTEYINFFLQLKQESSGWPS